MIKKLKEEGKIKIADSACGSACLPLALLAVLKEKGINYQKNIMIVCSDLDENAIQMAYVQLTLAGAKARCKNEDALRCKNEDALTGSWDTFSYAISGDTSLEFEVDYGRYKE